MIAEFVKRPLLLRINFHYEPLDRIEKKKGAEFCFAKRVLDSFLDLIDSSSEEGRVSLLEYVCPPVVPSSCLMFPPPPPPF